ncbi:MAG: hypothetical protein HYY17_11095 [Planctomycetes bacterium]|nr:hypothetical protein [Planctomycetota bacterium]
MTLRKIDRIRKRDGHVVAYDEAKIAEAIARAARAAGQEQPSVGRDLAGVVTLYLERHGGAEVPSSDDIRQLVEKVLLQTGNEAIARTFMRKPPQDGAAPVPAELFPANSLLVEGASRDELSTWGRGRISSALAKEAGLDPTAADEIAAAVEQRIFRLGMHRVASTLIRELVNHELIDRGFGSKLRKQLVVGLPKYDLGLLFGDEEGVAHVDPDGLCRTIGETTMRQYALQEILSRDVADAHLEGRIHVHGLEAPLKLWWLAPSVGYVRRHGLRAPGFRALEEPATAARALTAQLASVAEHARRYFSGGVEFLRLGAAYAGLPGNAGEEAEQLLPALGGSIAGIELEDGRFADEILAEWRAVPGRAEWPDREVVAGSSERLLREACRLAAERGGMLFLFDRSADRLSRFGGARGPDDWFAVAQAVTLNLPQAFYRSEAGSEFYAELEAGIDLAVKAHLQKRRLLRRFVHAPTRTFGHELGWGSNGAGALRFDDLAFVVGVCGLNEVVRLMRGREMVEDEDAQRLAFRIMSYLFFRVKEESGKHGLRAALEDYPSEDAAARFARIDAQMYPRARGLLEAVGAYSEGTHARPSEKNVPADVLAVERRFQTLVPSARAVLSPVHRARLSASDLFDLVRRLASESPAGQLHVR